MLRLSLGCIVVIFASGCTRSVWSGLVPKLDVRCILHRAVLEDAAADGRTRATVSAVLRWQPRVDARSLATPYELAPAAWIAPCDEADVECLREAVEAEEEVAAALRERPLP